MIQHPDNSISLAQPDMNSWSNLPSQTQTAAAVPVADLLNIKDATADNQVKPEKEVKIENLAHGVANMTIYGVPEEWKNSEIPVDLDKKTEDHNDAEYCSDSDNISIISGTISVDTDDTEPGSEEFVVIPLPQCFNCEQALNETVPVTQPITVEIPKTSSESSDISVQMQESDNNNNMELKPYPEIPIVLPVLMTPDEIGQGKFCLEIFLTEQTMHVVRITTLYTSCKPLLTKD